MYATHSPYFVDVEHFDQVRMCRKSTATAGEPRVTGFASFSRLQAAQRLAEITGRPAVEFTAQSFVTRAAPVLNTIVNEGLFADIAIVVEGESDVAALWTVQAFMEQRWEELGVVVVPVGGKNNIDRAVVAFQGFGIPTYFMFDGDKTQGVGASTNRLLLTLATETVMDYPVSFVGANCAAFEDDIEAHLQMVTGDTYVTLRDACAQRCGHDRPSKALKNSEVMSLFLRKARAAGFEFPMLCEIVMSVSRLAKRLRAAPGEK